MLIMLEVCATKLIGNNFRPHLQSISTDQIDKASFTESSVTMRDDIQQKLPWQASLLLKFLKPKDKMSYSWTENTSSSTKFELHPMLEKLREFFNLKSSIFITWLLKNKSTFIFSSKAAILTYIGKSNIINLL